MLTLRHHNKTQNKSGKKKQYSRRTYKAFFFPYRTEDKVCILFSHILQLSLGTMQKSCPPETALTNSNLTLILIVSCPRQVFLHTKHHFNTYLLMWLQHIIENIIGRKKKSHRTYRK